MDNQSSPPEDAMALWESMCIKLGRDRRFSAKIAGNPLNKAFPKEKPHGSN